MKSFITILAALVITATTFAAPPGSSRLTIVNTDHKSLRVIIDGNRYDGIGNDLSLGNISMGYHNIRIYQIRRGFFGGDRLLYSSSIFLKPDRQISLVVKRDGDVAINERSDRFDNRFPDRNGRDDRYGRDDRDGNNGYGRNDDRRNDDRRNNYPKY